VVFQIVILRGILNLGINDHYLFINSFEEYFITLLMYVDDIILTENDKEDIARIKQTLNQTSKIKDLGYLNLKYFIDLEVAYLINITNLIH